MDDLELIKKRIEESIDAKKEFLREAENISKASDAIVQSLKNGGKILVFGNGGSAADSQHIAAEIVGRFKKERKGLPAIALTTDTSILTSVGNDYGYDYIFARQIEALCRPEDLVIGLTTSGNSANVVSAIEAAKTIAPRFFYKQLRKPYYEAGIESKIRVVIYREGERCFAVLAGSHDEVRRFLSRMN